MPNRYEPDPHKRSRKPDDTPSLFDPDPPDPRRPQAGKAGRDHPDTSKKAARNVRYRVGSQKATVLLAIVRAGERGMNAAEAAPLIERSRNQTATRFQELREDGMIEIAVNGDGQTIERATSMGGANTGDVHVATALGQQAAERYLT